MVLMLKDMLNKIFENGALAYHSINYSIRQSKKAKRLHIKINRFAQVEVVSPLGTSQLVTEQFIKSNLDWINHQIEKIQSKNKDEHLLPDGLPKRIEFSSIEKNYEVSYLSNKNKSRFILNDDLLIITATTNDDKRQQLRDFIQTTAKHELTSQLNTLSQSLNLPFNKVFIRAQKTRWGSCSIKHNINLNRNILFLSPAQTKYLIIHELCHTVHLNHSKQYWNLVSQHCSEYKAVDKSLRNAALNVPLWAIKN